MNDLFRGDARFLDNPDHASRVTRNDSRSLDRYIAHLQAAGFGPGGEAQGQSAQSAPGRPRTASRNHPQAPDATVHGHGGGLLPAGHGVRVQGEYAAGIPVFVSGGIRLSDVSTKESNRFAATRAEAEGQNARRSMAAQRKFTRLANTTWDGAPDGGDEPPAPRPMKSTLPSRAQSWAAPSPEDSDDDLGDADSDDFSDFDTEDDLTSEPHDVDRREDAGGDLHARLRAYFGNHEDDRGSDGALYDHEWGEMAAPRHPGRGRGLGD